ncbi:MAG: DUF512 domain-containing protein [Christensenellales bacterium]|jgi:putative radical SAM enzyme (TIGR03279 family)
MASAQWIAQVTDGGRAQRAGILPGHKLLRINGEPVRDVIDYQALSAQRHLRLEIQDEAGRVRTAEIIKDNGEPLGLVFRDGLMDRQRCCCNSCVFCFVDQLPGGVRSSLRQKDDDWRLSLMMGNYITLTNVSDKEFERILRRRVSPLYISVHAACDRVRTHMLGNPRAGLMDRLKRLEGAGLRFHSQVVLCPGINDGDVLEETMRELYALYPAAASLAVVPVGLTAHRDGLAELRPVTEEGAAAVIDQIEAFAQKCLAESGTRFVWASDEFYVKAARPLSPYDAYEDFVQIENGVGLYAQMAAEFDDAMAQDGPFAAAPCHIVTGVSAKPLLEKLIAPVNKEGRVKVHAIKNEFFGESITVAGLVTGGDIIRQLCGQDMGRMLIPGCMLRQGENVFLDDTTTRDVEEALGAQIQIVPVDGAALLRALSGNEDMHE